MMNKYLIPILLLLMVIASPAHAADNDGVKRVVYHADFSDPRRFSAMLTSIYNMVNYYTNEFVDYDVRIVFVSHGIRFLTDDNLEDTPFVVDASLQERRDNLKGRLFSLNDVFSVKLELCNITRSQINLDPSKIYDNVETVPSGVVRIAELQDEGFAYLKVE